MRKTGRDEVREADVWGLEVTNMQSRHVALKVGLAPYEAGVINGEQVQIASLRVLGKTALG